MTNVNTSYEDFKTEANDQPHLFYFDLAELSEEQKDFLEANLEDPAEYQGDETPVSAYLGGNGFYFVRILDEDFAASKVVAVDAFANRNDVADRVRMALGVDEDTYVQWTPDISVYKHLESGVWNFDT
jgi:hypothetical protein